jgi:hypothetical protein
MMLGTTILPIRNNYDEEHVFLFTIFCYHRTHFNFLRFEITFFQKKVSEIQYILF